MLFSDPILVGSIFAILVLWHLLLATISYRLAVAKGRSGLAWGSLTFVLDAIGIVIVVMLSETMESRVRNEYEFRRRYEKYAREQDRRETLGQRSP